jgi:hypothetical protein
LEHAQLGSALSISHMMVARVWAKPQSLGQKGSRARRSPPLQKARLSPRRLLRAGADGRAPAGPARARQERQQGCSTPPPLGSAGARYRPAVAAHVAHCRAAAEGAIDPVNGGGYKKTKDQPHALALTVGKNMSERRKTGGRHSRGNQPSTPGRSRTSRARNT